MNKAKKQAIQKEIDQLTEEIEALPDGNEKLGLMRVRGRLQYRISDVGMAIDCNGVWVEYPYNAECPF